MRWLDEHGIGFAVGPARVAAPSVPSCRRRCCSTCGSATRDPARCRGGLCRLRGRGARGGRRRQRRRRRRRDGGQAVRHRRAMKGGLGTRLDHGRRLTVARAGRRQRDRRRGRPGHGRIVAGARGDDGRALRRRDGARCGAASWPRALQLRRQRRRRSASSPPMRALTKAAGDQGRADGARRPGAQHQPGPHDERRRHVFALATGASGDVARTRRWSARWPPRCSPRGAARRARRDARCGPTACRSAGGARFRRARARPMTTETSHERSSPRSMSRAICCSPPRRPARRRSSAAPPHRA